MGSLKVAWYAGIHPLGAGASTGGPVGSGSASYINSSSDLSVNAQKIPLDLGLIISSSFAISEFWGLHDWAGGISEVSADFPLFMGDGIFMLVVAGFAFWVGSVASSGSKASRFKVSINNTVFPKGQ